VTKRVRLTFTVIYLTRHMTKRVNITPGVPPVRAQHWFADIGCLWSTPCPLTRLPISDRLPDTVYRFPENVPSQTEPGSLPYSGMQRPAVKYMLLEYRIVRRTAV
jgi:hypothetical protein